jgi:chemotaxis protein histidine kinase CheA
VKRLQDELRQRNEDLDRISRTDALTGLRNRRHVEEYLAKLASLARRNLEPIAVLVIDIDHFKSVNDEHGHEAGDAVLREVVSQGSTTPGEVSLAPEVQTERRSVADGSIRFDVDRLDALMRLMDELVLTRNQSVAHAATAGDATLVRASARLNPITTELQEVVLRMRMQPIDNLWNKLPRVVRDLGAGCGKPVRLEMEGRETERTRRSSRRSRTR